MAIHFRLAVIVLFFKNIIELAASSLHYPGRNKW